jgi:hypothetical protein
MAVVFISNIVIYTHTDFEQTFVLEDTQSNSVMNLTGYTGCAQLKRYESSTKSADFAVNFSNDRTTGRVTLEMNASQTQNIKPGKYFYDLLLKDGTGKITRVVEGTVLVKKSITR